MDPRLHLRSNPPTGAASRLCDHVSRPHAVLLSTATTRAGLDFDCLRIRAASPWESSHRAGRGVGRAGRPSRAPFQVNRQPIANRIPCRHTGNRWSRNQQNLIKFIFYFESLRPKQPNVLSIVQYVFLADTLQAHIPSTYPLHLHACTYTVIICTYIHIHIFQWMLLKYTFI
jgi:hypothetical protein